MLPVREALAGPVAAADVTARRPHVGPATVSLADYCIGDGVENDANGVQRAINDLSSRGGGTLLVPERTYRIQPRGWIQVPDRIRIKGLGSGARFLLTQPSRSHFAVAFRIVGDGVCLEDVVLERGNDVYGSFLALLGSRAWVSDVTMIGNQARWRNDFNGAVLASNGSDLDTITLRNVTAHGCGYGLYQSEADRSRVWNVVVDNFHGHDNFQDDLGFSAPLGATGKITIQDSRLESNHSTSIGAGCAIGIARATDVTIQGCSFTGYPMNPIHVERESNGLIVRNCTFQRVSTFVTGWGYEACILLISGSRNALVEGNTFDLSQQTNNVTGLYAGPGGPGESDPTGIVLRGNKLVASGPKQLYVNYGVGTVSVDATTYVMAP